MNCRICGQETHEPKPPDETGLSGHHLERSPMDRELCLGCWMFTLDCELFFLRATGRSIWTLQAEAVVKAILEKMQAAKLPGQ